MAAVFTIPGKPRCSEGSFVRLADGRLLFAYTRFTNGQGDDAQAHIVARLGDGRGWDRNERILIGREGRQNTMSVSLLRLRDRRIALVYLVKNGPHDCRPWLRLSSDETKTWSAPRCLIPHAGYFVVNNDRLIELPDGLLALPAARHPTVGASIGPHATVTIIRTRPDDKSGAVVDARLDVPASGTGMQEPGLCLLPDGRLWCWARTDQGAQWQAFSTDHGVTWSKPEPSAFASPCSPMQVRTLGDGRLLAVWNRPAGPCHPATWGRTPLVAALSRDGLAWSEPSAIEVDPLRGFCYPAILPGGDGTAWLAYCAGGAATGGPLADLIVRKWPLPA